MKTNTSWQGKLRKWIPAAAAVALLGGPVFGQQPATTTVAKVEKQADAPVASPERAKIQMAILLDSSGSMSGLIDQARTQLWRAVNEFALAEHNGKPVMLEVALYEYGSDKYPANSGYLKQLLPLTDDLDRVSEALFAMTTNGSAEYCGQVIDTAVRDLEWSDRRADMKCIFIAGNEPFTQGPIDYRTACKAAATKGITVNTIHCGNQTEGISGMWQQGAVLADGTFMSIDHNQQIVAIEAPQDKQLVTLNEQLNKTYIPYGSTEKREASKARQVEQDANAGNFNSEVLANRVRFKSNAQYCNASWDLVDACLHGKVKLEDVKPEDLPEALRKMTPEQRKAHLEKITQQRTAVQKKIQEVTTQREAFLAEARKKQAGESKNTLDEALITAVRKQAAKSEYKFKKN